MIVSAFHTRNDHWILPHKCRVLSRLCDRFLVICDRDPIAEAIAATYPKAEVMTWSPTRSIGDHDEHGSVTCEEGQMRLAAWTWAGRQGADYVLLGDTDEVPSPDIREWFESRPDVRIDAWYFDCVNLWQDVDHEIASGVYWRGSPGANRRAMVCTWKPGRDYRYQDAIKHVRLEPSPLSEGRALEDETHVRVKGPMVVHYKWANWLRWLESPQARSEKYLRYLDGAAIATVPRELIWTWDAEEMLAALPEPIALVGNGSMARRGDEIDRCGSVVRFNNFRLEGFEPHVGRRTDLWVTSCWEDVTPRPWTGAMLTTSAGGTNKRTSSWLGTHPHMAVPRTSWRAECSAELGVRRPSTGLIVAHRLAKLGKSVRLYGFGGLVRGAHYWNPSHVHGHEDERPALRKLFPAYARELEESPGTESRPPLRIPRPCGALGDPHYNREPSQAGWYQYVAERAACGTVLDVGCGCGEGLAILRQAGCDATGQDIDPALEPFGAWVVDLAQVPAKSVDLVCAIDVLEHVIEDLAFLDHLKRIARREVIVTTPNELVSHGNNSCHAREYEPAQFAELGPTMHLMGSSDGSLRQERANNEHLPHQCGVWIL